jgi:type IV pilus assembly protein PilQ
MTLRSLLLVGTLLFCIHQSGAQNTVTVADTNTMSIDAKDTDIRDVIRMISKGYNLNILLDKDVTGKLTLHLNNVPIMEGLRSIAESNGLQVIKEGNVYKIQKATGEQKSLIRYSEGKLSVDVQNVNVMDFLKELSSKAAISIVPDVKVDGMITGKLYQVDIEDGLRALLESNGLKVTKRKNIYQVTKGSEQTGGQQYQGRSSPAAQGSRFNVDYKDGLVSLDISNGDLEDLIRAISEQSDIEIITYGSIKSEINAKLNNVPLTEALALLLGGTRFTFVQKDNVILIGDRNTATPSGQALSKSELIHLNHIKVDNLPSILPKDIPPTNVRVIKEQNALLISGTSEDIVTAKEFLNTIDIPTPQVRVDAVIVEFKDNLDKEFAIRTGRDNRLKESSYNLTPFPDHSKYPNTQNFEAGVSGKFLNEILRGINLPTLMNIIPDDLFSILRFLESQNKAKVLAQPTILTLNGNKASIDVSETQYFKVITGTGENQTSQFRPIKFGITLDITPWISQSGQITAEITPNVSNSDKTNDEGYPNVSARSITTTVRLNDGETLILGGLIKNQESEYSYKVPFLGSIPIIGALFRHSGKTRSKSNLVVFITPHIMTDKEPHINIQQELEKYDLHDKNIIEKQIYHSKKRVRARFNQAESTAINDTIEQNKTSSVTDSTIHANTGIITDVIPETSDEKKITPAKTDKQIKTEHVVEIQHDTTPVTTEKH